MPLSLPADEGRAFQLSPPGTNQRRIQLSPDTQRTFRVRSGEPATLMIRGENLWRNTTVLLGSQAASRVTVLPDMRGILATFDKVKPAPASGGADGGQLTLRVVTSEQSMPIGSVVIADDPRTEAAGVTQWSVAGASVIFPEARLALLATPRLPAAFADGVLRVVNPNRRVKVETGNLDIEESAQSALLSLPAKAEFKDWKNGETVELSFSTKRFPKDTVQQTHAMRPAIFYASQEDSEAVLTVTKPGDKQQTAELTLPARFKEAYPLLSKSPTVDVHVEASNAAGGKLALDLSCVPKGKEGRVCVLPLSFGKDHTIASASVGKGARELLPAVRIK